MPVFFAAVHPVFTRLRSRSKAKIVGRNAKKIISWLIKRNIERHKDFEDNVLLQPNLKEGKGVPELSYPSVDCRSGI
ncbi:MAG: hypothetical protein R2860_09135 [Desulfobacterales bacterium]